jgi:hypothetical protein
MKPPVRSSLYLLLLLSALIRAVWATDDSLATQFLGSPLLILVALIILDGMAFVYHKIRR